jgi:hypothetical protein
MQRGEPDMSEPKKSRVGKGRGRKPLQQVQQITRYDQPYEAIWSAIRGLHTFTMPELCSRLVKMECGGINEYTVKSYLQRLKHGGFIETEDIGKRLPYLPGVRYQYTLIKNVGVEAPRLTKKGEASKSGATTENLWRSIRILKSFSYRELAHAASTPDISIPVATAACYARTLAGAGYLGKIPGGLVRYKLLPSMNTGPKPPRVQSARRLYDPNLKKVVWQEGKA